MAKGYLTVNVYSDTIANPVNNAKVTISKEGKNIITETTNENGQTKIITLDTVDKSYSESDQQKVRPYETYDVSVSALSLTNTKIEGVQIFDGITSIQNVYVTSIDENQNEDVSKITPNTLWENNSSYSEDNLSQESSRILKEVVIPENIIVHDGIPTSTSAPNYTVPFINYIKNVASSEIYSTWPTETIKANVLAMISFALNRIYTEWYRSKGYDFAITSTTTYDQKYTKNGTIFEPISNVVDEIFQNYIRQGIRLEPLLAHYKNNTTEKGYLSQWGSKELGDKGYKDIEILKYYYGNTINLYEASTTQNAPYSFTTPLKEEDCNHDVYILQNTLNYIRGSYPGIPAIENPTGLFDNSTKTTVKNFQAVFNLPPTGTVDYQTWYKISYIFTAVTNMTNSIYS